MAATVGTNVALLSESGVAVITSSPETSFHLGERSYKSLPAPCLPGTAIASAQCSYTRQGTLPSIFFENELSPLVRLLPPPSSSSSLPSSSAGHPIPSLSSSSASSISSLNCSRISRRYRQRLLLQSWNPIHQNRDVSARSAATTSNATSSDHPSVLSSVTESLDSSSSDMTRLTTMATMTTEENFSAAECLPRFRTLQSFSSAQDKFTLLKSTLKDMSAASGITIFDLVAVNVEADAQVQSFETISGRAAMICFLTAVGLETFTGDSVFSNVDSHTLVGVGILSFLACASAASFALAWRARNHAAAMMAVGCKNLMDSAVDNIIDGLFFDGESDPIDHL